MAKPIILYIVFGYTLDRFFLPQIIEYVHVAQDTDHHFQDSMVSALFLPNCLQTVMGQAQEIQ